MPKLFGVVALAAAQLSAQSQPPTFRARADLVQVDVVVVDADGNPVRGLKATDFTLLDRKNAQAIASFDEVSHVRPRETRPGRVSSVAADVSDNQSAQAGRLVVLVIDDLHIYKERTERAREIAHKVLADLAPASSMAVLFTSGEQSTQVTADPARLRAAVDSLKGRQSWRRPHPGIDKQTGDRINPEDSMEIALAKIQKSQDTKAQDFFDNIAQYKTLQDAARMLGAGDARRKAFVLISEGIAKELSGLFGAMAPAGDAPQGGGEYATGGSPAAIMAVPPHPYHDFALIDMMESMRRANVATYAIDPRGRVESKDLARECFPPPASTGIDPCSSGFAWKSDIRLAQNGLKTMAEASGGFAVTNTDDFTSGVARIVGDLDHYYLLGFYPDDAKGRGYRRLEVTVAGHPEWKLRYRHGYLPGGPAPPKISSEMVALSAGVLPKGDVPLRLFAVARPGSGAASIVGLVLEVTMPRAAMEEADGRLRDTLKYEVLVVDEKKKRVRSVGGLEAQLTLSATARTGPAPDVATYHVSDSVEVQPGRYEFRVAAASAKLGKGGSAYLTVDVPHFRSAPVVLGGIALGYADGARVPIAPRSVPPPLRGARGAAPVAARPAALPIPASLDRTFRSSDTLRLYAEGTVRGGTAPGVAVAILDAGGGVVRSPAASVSTDGGVKILADVPLGGLTPGSYVLRVSLSAGAHSASREIGFAVR